MASSDQREAKVTDVPAWITSKEPEGDFRSTRAIEVIEEEVTDWEIDKVKYQEARRELRHLSFTSYITLAFYAVSTGWFLSLAASRPYLALVLGSTFLFLLYMHAKTSRVAEDNIAIVKKLDRTYKSKARFKSSSIEGVGSFLSYVVLSCTTAYFLLYPNVYRLSYHSMRFLGPFLLLSALIFVVSYYLLADGKMGKAALSRRAMGRKFLSYISKRTRMIQATSYAATFLALLFYWYVVWL